MQSEKGARPGADLNAKASPFAVVGRQPAARVGRRFLPLPAAVLPPLGQEPGPVVLAVAAGTPVHAIESARVAAAEGTTVGEVVLQVPGNVRLTYHRLLPRSVAVREGDRVMAGDVLGTVAPDPAGGPAALHLSAQRADGTWVRLADRLCGLPDPSELFLPPPDMRTTDHTWQPPVTVATPRSRNRTPAGTSLAVPTPPGHTPEDTAQATSSRHDPRPAPSPTGAPEPPLSTVETPAPESPDPDAGPAAPPPEDPVQRLTGRRHRPRRR